MNKINLQIFIVWDKVWGFSSQKIDDSMVSWVRAPQGIVDVRICVCVCVCVSGTTVNHIISPSSVCYKVREGSLLSERGPPQNRDQGGRSAAATTEMQGHFWQSHFFALVLFSNMVLADFRIEIVTLRTISDWTRQQTTGNGLFRGYEAQMRWLHQIGSIL